jgi:hypothetical protein
MGLTKPRAAQIYDLDYKQAVRVITVTDIATLSGGAPNQVDGVSLSLNDRVLVAGQNTGSQNGLYYVQTVGTGSNGTWARTSDGNETGEIEAGMIVMVTEGVIYADTQWKLTTNDPIVIGVSALTFVINILSTVGGANTQVQFNDGGTLGATAQFTFNKTSNAVVVGGNVTGANILTGGIVSATGNITGNYILGNGSQLTGITTAPAGSDTEVQFNNSGAFGSSSNFTFDGSYNSGAGLLSVGYAVGGVIQSDDITACVSVTAYGPVTASGNLTSYSGLDISGDGTISGNIAGGNITTAGLVTSTGNVVGGNITTAGLVTATGNVVGGNLSTAGLVTATGNVVGGNLSTAGLITATGNVTGANLITTGNVDANNVNTDTVYSSGALNLLATSGDITLSPSGNIVMDSGKYINNVNNPVQAQDAATKQYVDNSVSTGIDIHEPVQLLACTFCVGNNYTQGGSVATVTATVAGNTVVFGSAISPQVNDQLWFTNSFEGILGNVPYFVVSAPNTSSAVLSLAYSGAPVTTITSNTGLSQSVRINSGVGATIVNANANVRLSVDSTLVTTGDRILLTAQTDPAQNGVYEVTDQGAPDSPGPGSQWVLTRATDMDTYIPNSTQGVDSGDYFYVQNGVLNKGESWVMTDPVGPVIIGYTGLTFTQFGASQVYSAGTGLTLNGTTFSINASQTQITSVGTLGSLSVTGNISGGNLLGTSIVGTLTTAAQTNITSVGTLGSLAVTANITGGNLVGTLNGSGANVTSISATNISSGTLAQARLANAAVTLGSTALTLGSTVTTVAGLSSVTSTTFVGALTGAATTAGTVTTAAQPNITSVGTLSSLAVTGNVTGGNLITAGLVSLSSITKTGTNGVGNIGAAGATFNTVFAKATSAQYADLAEMYVSDADYTPGTVVDFGGSHEITISSVSHSTAVAGIVSTNPSYLMNSSQPGEHVLPVALTGRVPCRVQGPVRKGDVLVASSTPGVAQRIGMNWQPGCVLGKSMEAIDSAEIKIIEVAVGRF